MRYDHIVVGGGIVGISAAWQLARRKPGARIAVIEKEAGLARHQTGRNSGVIHAGVYYAPGSLKARFCRQGLAATEAFCASHDIAFDRCGKLIVATAEHERARLADLLDRARVNGARAELLDAAQLREREPAVQGVGAILVHDTGIVSYTRIVEAMAREFHAAGGEIVLSASVVGLEERADAVHVRTTAGDFTAGSLVVCAGLMADRLVAMAGVRPQFRIVPFRGEYFRLPPERNALIRHLIYPVPDPALPFLGVHLTRMIDGSVTVGPNAVLAFAREGYRRGDVNLRDLAQMAAFPGAWRLLARHAGAALDELRSSLCRRHYLRLVQRYCPSLVMTDLLAHPAGVRAQAVSSDGAMVQDFLFVQTARTLHVGNAPSPAATSAIPIGGHIVDRLLGVC
ncbi:MAG: L-2-hydroxyglutarate oxidase [Gammaproteobacteria bacterium]